MLGGVRIPHHHGLLAHSDGDVALHALCDALLGAAALGDIGQHFPPTDEQWREASSVLLLQQVGALVQQQGWKVVNVDLTLACEAPRIAPHVMAMRTATAAALQLDVNAVSVKATTTEKLGFCGREEGIAALAIALLKQA
jgi:2-C-methyl-D-erythritol 2,4-cyclodiphosphate synthase